MLVWLQWIQAVSPLVVVGLGAVANHFRNLYRNEKETRQRRFQDIEAEINDLRCSMEERVRALENRAGQYVSHQELHTAIEDLRTDIRHMEDTLGNKIESLNQCLINHYR